MNEEYLKQSVWFWMLIAIVLISQSTWLFLDAGKRGGLKWFWGIWGLISFPLPLLVYWLIEIKYKNRRGRE